MRKEFAELADDFSKWSTAVKGEVLQQNGGTLEEQFQEIQLRAEQIESSTHRITELEESNSKLERAGIEDDNPYTGMSLLIDVIVFIFVIVIVILLLSFLLSLSISFSLFHFLIIYRSLYPMIDRLHLGGIDPHVGTTQNGSKEEEAIYRISISRCRKDKYYRRSNQRVQRNLQIL